MAGPLRHTYWVTDRLAAGVHPLVYDDLQRLVDAGFDTFVDLTERATYEVPGHRHFPIPDMGVPDDVDPILDAIDEALADGRTVYVHCFAGRGRTGTVIGCWLARHGATDPLADLAALRAHLDSPSPETAGQRRFVRSHRP
jgi:protein-tyrosine phosphatase